MTKQERNEHRRNWNRTKKGLLSSMYSRQRSNSKKRGMPMPTYTSQEFREVLLNMAYFHELYDQWVESGYINGLIPSIDRINDYISYTEDNIQLMTWDENRSKYHKDSKEGKNNKANKAVNQYTKDGIFVATFRSIKEASRQVDTHQGNITSCCKGKLGSAGGFRWGYRT